MTNQPDPKAQETTEVDLELDLDSDTPLEKPKGPACTDEVCEVCQ